MTDTKELPARGYICLAENILQMLLQGIFPDIKRGSDLVVIAELENLF